MEDIKLVELYKSWDNNAFEIIYDRYIDKIYSFIFHKVYDKTITEDITSNTFLKVVKSLKNFDTTKNNVSLQSWIYKIAYNNVVDFYRTQKEELWLDNLIDDSFENDLWSDIDNKDKLKEVLTYLESLNSEHREILIMRIWDNLSYREIAQITWKTEDNCKKIVSRTLMKINSNISLVLLVVVSLYI